MKYLQLFSKRIIRRRDNVDYLVRWTLLGIGRDSNWFSIKLHHILISDEECLHNHPWPFVSILLRGSYTEHIRALPWSYNLERWSFPEMSEKNGFCTQHKTFKAGQLIFRPAHWSHRLKLDAPVWTLVFTFKKIQRWGFFTKRGWVPHWKYNEQSDC